MTNGLRTVLPRSFNAATERVEVLKGPASTLYGILDPGGLINVVTKRPEKPSAALSATSTSFGGGTGQVDVTGPIDGTRLAYRLTGSIRTKITGAISVTNAAPLSPLLTWFGDDATVTVLYSHRDYKTPFDRGDLRSQHQTAGERRSQNPL
jgi:iron complex outermembrane receptor protein